MKSMPGVLAASVLAVGLLISVIRLANAAPACGHRCCKDEVNSNASISGGGRAACFKTVIQACKSNACDCGGPAPGCTTTTGSCADVAATCSPSGAFLD
jgi:hypothetical protein